MQAVILAGGKGARLAERLNGRPKPLVDVCGVPLLQRQLTSLIENGVDEVVLLVNHAADQISAFIQQHNFSARIKLVDDGEPRGTAGATLAALDDLDDRFLVIYGDTLFHIDVGHMLEAHVRASADATLFLHPNDHPADSDLVDLDDEGWVTAFHPYPHPKGTAFRNLVNAAFYVIERRALEPWRGFERPADFAKDLFPAMLEAKARLYGYVSYEYIKDLGTPKRLDKVERHLAGGAVERASRNHRQSAVFLDRDGTLNELRGYIRKPEELELIPGAAEAVRRLNEAERRVVLVTNQPVIARGEVTVARLRHIHNKLETALGAVGAHLDAIYYCPHHPDAGYDGEIAALKVACACRKPGVALFERAIEALNIDPTVSWMIGDSTADLLAAKRAGLRSVLVDSGEGGRDGKYPAVPDFHVRDLIEAANLITSGYAAIAERLVEVLSRIDAGDLVLIGGAPRSGKSTVATVLKLELLRRNLAVAVVLLDRPAWQGKGKGVDDASGPSAAASTRWPGRERATLEALLAARRRSAPLQNDPLRIFDPDPQVLIAEGAAICSEDWSESRKTWRVYVEVDEELRRRRVTDDLARHGLGRNASDGIYKTDEARDLRRAEQSDSFIVRADIDFGTELSA